MNEITTSHNENNFTIQINTTDSEDTKITNNKSNMYNVTISLFEKQSNYAHDLDRLFCR